MFTSRPEYSSPSLLLLAAVSAGTDGGLDFGVIRVLDEAKQMLSLKNKGKYEIGYR